MRARALSRRDQSTVTFDFLLEQLCGDQLQVIVAQDLDRTLIVGQRVVKGDLVGG